MDELLYLKKFVPFFIPILVILFIVVLTLMIGTSSSGDANIMAGTMFIKPFKEDIHYTITSKFGYRVDPINKEEIRYHSGIDLAVPMGTEIISIGNGIVYDVVYSDEKLGNHVYIKHNYNNMTYYSLYAHMLDDSIVVTKGQIINAGDTIGLVGMTGRATGYHLHLTLMSPIVSFNKKYLVDPYYVIEGL